MSRNCCAAASCFGWGLHQSKGREKRSRSRQTAKENSGRQLLIACRFLRYNSKYIFTESGRTHEQSSSNARNRKWESTKFNENLIKSKGLALKFCTGDLYEDGELSRKNHRPESIQTPEKSDHIQKREKIPKKEISLILDARVELIKFS